MKKLLLLFLVFGLFACSSDSDDDDSNPVYLDANGVTIKARDWAVVGDSGTINGITYTIVDGATLSSMIENDDDISRTCTTRIVGMENMFVSPSFNQDISSWDVSNVFTMRNMFSHVSSFNQDIGHWDVSNVTDMGYMFNNEGPGSDFNQDISGWNVSSVTDMNSMFRDCENFNQDLSSWDVGNVNVCENIFEGTSAWTLPKPNFTNCSPID